MTRHGCSGHGHRRPPPTRSSASVFLRRPHWVLAEIEEPGALWQAEAHWWRTVQVDGAEMLHNGRCGPRVVVGAVAVLSVDAWRVRAALGSAARGGRPWEVFDALV